MNQLPDARTALAQTLESEASWSVLKAHQYQDDRTERWAAAALACAAYLRARPDDDDERVNRIAAACAWNQWQDGLHLGKDASLWASRCELPPEQFLDALAMAAESDAQRDHDDARKHGHPDADQALHVESRRDGATCAAIRAIRTARRDNDGCDGAGDPAALLTSWLGPITDPGYRARQDELMGAVVGIARALAEVMEQLDPGRADTVFDTAAVQAQDGVAAPH